MRLLLLTVAAAAVLAAGGSMAGRAAPAGGVPSWCGPPCRPSEPVAVRWDDGWTNDAALNFDMLGAAGDCPACGLDREVQVLTAEIAGAGIGGYRPPVVAQIFDPLR